MLQMSSRTTAIPPSLNESMSLWDLIFTCIAPSRTCEVLSENFNEVQLVRRLLG
ncbi:hypothetical protein BDR07DRAFT_1425788, partial [Suillus spraguei]